MSIDHDDVTPPEGTNQESEVIEETEAGEETTDETEAGEAKTYTAEEFGQVLARAKKAEGLLKKVPKPAQNITNKPAVPSDEIVEEKILKIQGMSDELISELKAVAKARGKSLIDSVNDPIFVAIKTERETEAKAQKAKLGASKGSGSMKKEKAINSPGISDEDHKAMWREQRDK